MTTFAQSSIAHPSIRETTNEFGLSFCQVEYLHKVLNQEARKRVIDFVISVIALIEEDYRVEAIAASGLSGMAIAPIISYLTGIPLIHVDKDDESSHSDYMVRGEALGNNYIILDDFIESGQTLYRIIKTIEHEEPDLRCVGAIFYEGHSSDYELHEDFYFGVNFLNDLHLWGCRDRGGFDPSASELIPHEIVLHENPDK